MTPRHVRGRSLIAALVLAFVGPVGLAAAQQRATTPKCFGGSATIVGTPGSDALTGGPGPDVIVGLGGDDAIVGGGGDDLLCGGPGTDIIFGGPGDDQINGGDGQDGLNGNTGNDALNGGGNTGSANADFVDYEQAGGPVQVDLSTQTATGADGSDRLSGIESAFGSRFDDVVAGDSKANILGGEGGNDTVNGKGGQDSAWFDAAVKASLATGSATGEGSDSLVGLEGLIGSEGNDALVGDGGANDIAGRAGNDMISGGGGDDREFGDAGVDHIDGSSGTDYVDGGDGNDVVIGGGDPQDTVSYLSAPFAGVSVDLAAHTATGGAGSDTVSGFANVSGSEFRDKIVGDAASNALYGNAGNDTISGAAGADFVGGGSGANRLLGGAGNDYCLAGSGANQCELHGVPRLPTEAAAKPPVGVPPRAAQGHRASIRLGSGASRVYSSMLSKLQALSDVLGPSALAGRAPAYHYVGSPSCFTTRHPYRTSIAPPQQVDPVGRDGEAEEAWWQGQLYRLNAATRRWRPYRKTAWARGTLAGTRRIAGIPSWQSAKLREPVTTFSYTVPAGSYTWHGEIYWRRNGAFVSLPVEPHLVYARSVHPGQDCRFGS